MAGALGQRVPPTELVRAAFRVPTATTDTIRDVDFAFRALRCSGQVSEWLEETNAVIASIRPSIQGVDGCEAETSDNFAAEQLILKRV